MDLKQGFGQEIMFFWSFYLSRNPEFFFSRKNITNITLIKIRNISWAPNQMISEGLCDAKDLNNSCWKISFAIAGINDIL